MKNILNEVGEIIGQLGWLLIISGIGGFLGFVNKGMDVLKGRPLWKQIYLFIVGVVSSMFIAYVCFEILEQFTQNHRLSVAISGFAAYIGTDLLVVLQAAVIDKIKEKIGHL